MIKIDEDAVIKDLTKVTDLFRTKGRDFVKREINNFIVLNTSLEYNTGFKIPYDDLEQREYFMKAYDKYYSDSYSNFVNKVDKEQDLLKNISYHFCNFAKKIKLDDIYFFDEIKEYSEQDFKDIIISYFATYGDKYYKIAKKYFDENRINVGSKLFTENAGFYIPLVWLESGYIYSLYPTYDSVSAASIVHELGHAVDAETFLFPQQKKLPIFSDILLEIPSTTFEIGFYDYLRKQKIDSDGALILKNNRTAELLELFTELKAALSANNLSITEKGIAIDENNNTYNLKEDILYGLGYYFALHLNEINECSSNEFQKIFYNIISTRNESTLTDSILMTGFNLNDFITCKYIKPKIKEDYLTLKKRYKIY